jgi:hypothetical protein
VKHEAHDHPDGYRSTKTYRTKAHNRTVLMHPSIATLAGISAEEANKMTLLATGEAAKPNGAPQAPTRTPHPPVSPPPT